MSHRHAVLLLIFCAAVAGFAEARFYNLLITVMETGYSAVGYPRRENPVTDAKSACQERSCAAVLLL